jgi:hypothetical protein
MSFNCDNNKDNCDKCKYPKNIDTCTYNITDKTGQHNIDHRGDIPCSRNIDNITVPYKTGQNINMPCPGSLNTDGYDTYCSIRNGYTPENEMTVTTIILLSTSIFFFLLFIIFMVKNYRKGIKLQNINNPV